MRIWEFSVLWDQLFYKLKHSSKNKLFSGGGLGGPPLSRSTRTLTPSPCSFLCDARALPGRWMLWALCPSASLEAQQRPEGAPARRLSPWGLPPAFQCPATVTAPSV